MTKNELLQRERMAYLLHNMGFTGTEVIKLRRASNTLHRWYEGECGDSGLTCSWCIERDEATGKPYKVVYYNTGRTTRTPIADREAGALKRVKAICASHGMRPYVQTDPRGAPLYILRPDDVREGDDIGSVYTRGVCVW